MFYRIISFFSLLIILSSCQKKHEIVIAIQPLGNFENNLSDTVKNALQEFYGYKVVILKKQEIPKSTFVNIRSPRYRADLLIKYFKKNKPDSVDYIIALTNQDISITKRNNLGIIKEPKSKYIDFGIFGLGYMPGVSCVVSTFRLNNGNNKQFIKRIKKICVHEVGHNLGLNHCPNKNCVMQDAAESIKTIDNAELGLCKNCRLFVKNKKNKKIKK